MSARTNNTKPGSTTNNTTNTKEWNKNYNSIDNSFVNNKRKAISFYNHKDIVKNKIENYRHEKMENYGDKKMGNYGLKKIVNKVYDNNRSREKYHSFFTTQAH